MSENQSQVTIEFELPVGYTDGNGVVHKSVTMRRQTAADYISLMKDVELQELARVRIDAGSANPVQIAFALAADLETDILAMARVITRFGDLPLANGVRSILRQLVMADIKSLRDNFAIINNIAQKAKEAAADPLASTLPS